MTTIRFSELVFNDPPTGSKVPFSSPADSKDYALDPSTLASKSYVDSGDAAAKAYAASRANHSGTQALSTIAGLQDALDAKLGVSRLGAPSGAAPLGSNGKIDMSYLPSDGGYTVNLTATYAAGTVTVNSSAGTGVAINAATTSLAGLLSSTDKTKLDGIANAATANATDAQLRDRSTHTGTQAAGTITGLGPLATASVVTSSQISDASTAGKALLTAANAGAQKVLLNFGTSDIAGLGDASTRATSYFVAASTVGAAGGVCPLGSDTKIPSTYLPASTSPYAEYANLAALPGTGVSSRLYLTMDTNRLYRWNGSSYVEASPQPATTDNVTEGSTRLYHTNARASAAAPVQTVAGRTGAIVLSTNDVSEGANLYHTSGRVNTLISAAVGTVVQAFSSTLDALAALTTTSFGRSFLTLSNAASARTLVGTVIGTDVQAYAPNLTGWAAIAPSSKQDADANTAKTNVAQSYTRAQRGTPVALTSTSAAIAIDLSASNNFTHTTTENSTLSNPSNVVAGQSGFIIVTQGATPRTLAFASQYKFVGGTAPTLTASASAVDVFGYYVISSTQILITAAKGVA